LRFLTNDKKIEINKKKTLNGNAEGSKEIPIKKQICPRKIYFFDLKKLDR
tara:strand:- start:373 stop:522 length:150 start_codon:yes stop_codon:yes gene_type:complete